jgi:hypothetical protein
MIGLALTRGEPGEDREVDSMERGESRGQCV